MKHFESGLKFLSRHYILALPLVILFSLSNLLRGTASTGLFNAVGEISSRLINIGIIKNPVQLFKSISLLFPMIAGGALFTFVLGLAVYPATYGLVNKALDTGNAGLNDFLPALQQNFVKYFLYWVGTIVVTAVFALAFLIILGLLGPILSVFLGIFGTALMVLISIALALVGIIAAVLLSFWFSAMLVDGMDVMAAAKKSVEVAWSAFLTIIGFTLLVEIIGSVIRLVLGNIFFWFPFIVPIILGIISAAKAFIMIVFFLWLYREKTGRHVAYA